MTRSKRDQFQLSLIELNYLYRCSPTNGSARPKRDVRSPTNGSARPQGNVRSPTKVTARPQGNVRSPTNDPARPKRDVRSPTNGSARPKGNVRSPTKAPSRVKVALCRPTKLSPRGKTGFRRAAAAPGTPLYYRRRPATPQTGTKSCSSIYDLLHFNNQKSLLSWKLETIKHPGHPEFKGL